MIEKCTEERFLSDVEYHEMEVVRDEGKNGRHIKFSKNGSSYYFFDIITWPGHLCISSDCGTYVFRRLADMFEFFRTKKDRYNRANKLNINPEYWGEKLQSVGTNAGYKEFDSVNFECRVKAHFLMFFEQYDVREELENECWQEIKDRVLRFSDQEHEAYNAVAAFQYTDPKGIIDFYFADFFDSGDTDSFTFSYIWCLYAIAWGVGQYDESKQKSSGEIK